MFGFMKDVIGLFAGVTIIGMVAGSTVIITFVTAVLARKDSGNVVRIAVAGIALLGVLVGLSAWENVSKTNAAVATKKLEVESETAKKKLEVESETEKKRIAGKTCSIGIFILRIPC